MSYQGIQNNPLFIPLTEVAISTGWTMSNNQATHQSCNDGFITMNNYSVVIGKSYKISIIVNYITSGILYGVVGGAVGSHLTAPGLYVQQFTAITTEAPKFYANGNCQIQSFAIETVTSVVPFNAQNTIAFAEKINKWTSFYTFVPDSAFSMFTKTYSFNQGDIYLHEANTPNRCNFYGTQYPSTIYFSTNQQPTLAKTFQSINYQANQLLVTPSLGINTSTGQQSELINLDFVQATYHDGVNPDVIIYDSEGLYKSSFMREFPDLVNGNQLKGNWMTIGLETTSPSTILALFTCEIEYNHSYQNIR